MLNIPLMIIFKLCNSERLEISRNITLIKPCLPSLFNNSELYLLNQVSQVIRKCNWCWWIKIEFMSLKEWVLYFHSSVCRCLYIWPKVLQTILSANLLVTKLQCSSSVALHHKILWQHRTTNTALLLPSGKLSDLEDQASCRGAVRGAQVRAGWHNGHGLARHNPTEILTRLCSLAMLSMLSMQNIFWCTDITE